LGGSQGQMILSRRANRAPSTKIGDLKTPHGLADEHSERSLKLVSSLASEVIEKDMCIQTLDGECGDITMTLKRMLEQREHQRRSYNQGLS
jgi:hypothetical protein